MIGSRWFRVVFILMVLFVGRMVFRAATMSSDEDLDVDLSAGELYTAFQNDRGEMVDKYGGKRINIDGYVCEILGDDKPTAITLIGYNDDCASQRMIECLLWEKRGYNHDRFSRSQEIGLRCHVMEDQDKPWIKLDYCKVIMN